MEPCLQSPFRLHGHLPVLVSNPCPSHGFPNLYSMDLSINLLLASTTCQQTIHCGKFCSRNFSDTNKFGQEQTNFVNCRFFRVVRLANCGANLIWCSIIYPTKCTNWNTIKNILYQEKLLHFSAPWGRADSPAEPPAPRLCFRNSSPRVRWSDPPQYNSGQPAVPPELVRSTPARSVRVCGWAQRCSQTTLETNSQRVVSMRFCSGRKWTNFRLASDKSVLGLKLACLWVWVWYISWIL